MPEHQIRKLLITSPACAPIVSCSFLVSLVTYSFLVSQFSCSFLLSLVSYSFLFSQVSCCFLYSPIVSWLAYSKCSVSRLLSNGTYYRTHKLTEKMCKYTSAPNESVLLRTLLLTHQGRCVSQYNLPRGKFYMC